MAIITNTAKTLADMRSEVLFMCSESSNSRIFTPANLDVAINNGLSLVSKTINREPVIATFSTSNGSVAYAIPDPILQYGQALVDSVEVAEDDVTFEAIDAIAPEIPSGTDTGVPASYYLIGNTLYLSPIPDGEYSVKVRYRQEHRKLINTTDIPLLSDIGVNAAIFYACYLLKLKDEQYNQADRFKAEYEDALKASMSLQTGVYRVDPENNFYGGTR